MPQSKEIQEQMRNKVTDIYQSGKGYKAICNALELQWTPVRDIINKWRKHGTMVNLLQTGQPTKITPGAHRLSSLASVKVSVHDSTMKKRLGKNGIHGGIPKRKPLLAKKNTKGPSNICQKTSWWSRRLTGKYFVDGRDKSGTFWKVHVPLHLV